MTRPLSSAYYPGIVIRFFIFHLLAFLLPKLPLSAQDRSHIPAAPSYNDFHAAMIFLASPATEGREAGKRGSLLASDYIVASMIKAGLKPAGNLDFLLPGKKDRKKRESWKQHFNIALFSSYPDSAVIISSVPAAGRIFHEIATYNNGKSQTDTVRVHNIMGMIPGRNRSKTIVIGAHYDHLGIRNDSLYAGANDNASGIAGMLALASKWAALPSKPSCNILFAAWTAEEKGVLGSEYFVKHSGIDAGKIALAINMDMIAGNAPEDTTGVILSIGTGRDAELLDKMAVAINDALGKHLSLDLWNVDGHYGSDYAFFNEANVPVMTFFSGFTDNYHSPGDTIEKTDTDKMENILLLVNQCLGLSLQRISEK